MKKNENKWHERTMKEDLIMLQEKLCDGKLCMENYGGRIDWKELTMVCTYTGKCYRKQ